MHEAMAQELSTAVRDGDSERVREILRREPSLADGYGVDMSPLQLAVYSGKRDMATTLIECGASVDVFLASALGDLDRVRALLQDEPDLIAAYSEDGWTPLHLAAHFGSTEVAELLLAHGADVEARSRSREGNTPLHAAVAGKQPSLVDLLIARGADVDAADAGGWTALNIAAHEGVPAIIESLLRAGADPTIPSNDGQTPRQTAEREGHADIAGYFPASP